ncbi:single-stranded DNA-binding protein [Pseudomonas sp. S9]|uniref:single-stranded DNA-binding protein n=1 Tax=Pseudomonas sp. S9 TaxID=686578 RepID=UPI0002556DCE|nr:single-stranded DNA-binding protein [Pseudomonas sp. S9]
MPVSEFGRIGRDAELRYTSGQNPTAVCSIPVAVDYGRKGEDGNKPTQWYEVTRWESKAEALATYLTKGKQVFSLALTCISSSSTRQTEVPV